MSLHAIDEHIDQGILLHRMKIPILPEDTLQAVADRAYEMECDLQADFEQYLPKLKAGRKITDQYPLSKKRVPAELDAELESIFQRNKEVLISHFTEA